MPRFAFKGSGVELELEGDQDFILDNLSSLLKDALEIVGKAPSMPPVSRSVGGSPPAAGERMREGTINSVTAKIGGKTCRDLIVAAAVHLSLFDGKVRFSREELEARARDANSWKAAYTNQKAIVIKRLVQSGHLIENASNVFSLADEQVTAFEARLAA